MVRHKKNALVKIEVEKKEQEAPKEVTKECPTCKGDMIVVEDVYRCRRPTCGHQELIAPFEEEVEDD